MSERIFKNMNNRDGISLIALIITIIVIVILTAIVVESSLSTPERANWAKFTSDYSNIQQMIGIKQTELYGKYAMGQIEIDDGRIPTRAEIYQAIATGSLPENGLVNDVNEISFSENPILNINKPKNGGKWFLSSEGKLSYEGYKYNETTWTTPTQEGQITGEMIASNGNYNSTAGVNSPKLAEGMIPIYYDDTAKVWKKADATNSDGKWYAYTTVAKRYANICTVSNEINNQYKYRTAEVNTTIPISHMTTMFVWIPRYAYSINTGGYKIPNADPVGTTNASGTKKINVTFLVGTSDKDKDSTIYPKDYNADSIAAGVATPKIVHPGFTFGGRELSGIWIAKFEASGKDSQGRYVGNSDTRTWEETFPPDASTHVQILPGAISWRHITVGECQYRSMQMTGNKGAYGWSNVNTHLIKDREWGAVAYLSYSQYGQIPMINAAGIIDEVAGIRNFYTGAGPNSASNEVLYNNYTEATKGYNTSTGILASTTGNVYGIYDMSGGTAEYVAAYIDNKNSNLTTYGKSTSNPSVEYFTNGELNLSYADYWDRHEASAEEREGATTKSIVTLDGMKTQEELCVGNITTMNWNEARFRLTEYIYKNMLKGIGISETSEKIIYMGVIRVMPYDIYAIVVAEKNGEFDKATGWNGDYKVIGNLKEPFMRRGGSCNDESLAGILYTYRDNGRGYYGFRPVLVNI